MCTPRAETIFLANLQEKVVSAPMQAEIALPSPEEEQEFNSFEEIGKN